MRVLFGYSLAALLALAVAVSARNPAAETVDDGRTDSGQTLQPAGSNSPARAETTWIFDANFEDFTGDNWGIQDLGLPGDELTGWYTTDRSGGRPQGVYWHTDSFMAYPDGTPPDTSMWCGTCEGTECWAQPCGYGNDWSQHLVREFDLTEYSGEPIVLEFMQQYAMEKDYDYGYLDVSDDSGSTWTTLNWTCNPGYVTGIRIDWDDPYGRPFVSLGLDQYGGDVILLRWRVESDGALSSEDQPLDSQYGHSVYAGAWFIDEVGILVGADSTEVFRADFENASDPDNAGWLASTPPLGETGVVWQREYNPPTGNDSIPYEQTGWMLTAVDSTDHQMADSQKTWLYSPIITLSGVDTVYVRITGWREFGGGDRVSLYVVYSDSMDCIGVGWDTKEYIGSIDEGPEWGSWAFQTRNSDALSYARFLLRSWSPTPTNHKSGLYINRFRVGVLGEPTEATQAEPDPRVSALSLDIFPNPTLGQTEFAIGGAVSSTELLIYNLRGELVRRLESSVANASKISWDGASEDGHRMPSGLYFVRARSGDQVTTSKLVILH
jgi:hypothetical protein